MDKRNQFSARENDVIDLLLQGKSNKQIAYSLGVSNRTIEFHLSNIYQKLGVNSRSEAILFFSNYKPENSPLRDSTVEPLLNTKDTEINPVMRTPMRRNVIFLAYILVLVFLCLYLTPVSNIQIGNEESLSQIQTPETLAASTPISTVEIATDSINQAYLFEQTVGENVVQLIVNWFYIDTTRTHLDLSICNIPLPENFKPVYLVDPTKIILKTADGNLLETMLHINSGGGSGGEEETQLVEKDFSCYDQTFDYYMLNSVSRISSQDIFQLEIPIGGSIIDETGKTIIIPVIQFIIKIKPTFSDLLTFSAQNTALLDKKNVTFTGVEVNPKSATVNLCVYDPNGEQWLPSVILFYKGKIISPVSSGLSDDSNEDPKYEMCYRINYSDSFQFETASELKESLSILVTKLSKDQPERLPDGLIAHVQYELSLMGIEFNYLVMSHGSDIVITKKPINLTDKAVFSKIYEGLSKDTETAKSILFNLE